MDQFKAIDPTDNTGATSTDAINAAMESILSGRGSDHERAFRRGFHHAYEQAIIDVINGATLEEMEACGDAIQEWRNGYGRGDDVSMEAPRLVKSPKGGS